MVVRVLALHSRHRQRVHRVDEVARCLHIAVAARRRAIADLRAIAEVAQLLRLTIADRAAVLPSVEEARMAVAGRMVAVAHTVAGTRAEDRGLTI